MQPGDPKYRYLYAVWSFFECLLFGGLIYGWGSLVYVLKEEGLYLHLCEGEDGGNQTEVDVVSISNVTNGSLEDYNITGPSVSSCDARDTRLALVFTVGSSVFCAGSFFMGQINFKFGTRITRLTATVSFVLGALLIAFTNNDVPWLIFPGLCLLGIGGVTILMTNTQVSLLFPVGSSAVIGFIIGGYDASNGVLLLVKIAYENGISRQTSFIFLACLHLLTLVSTFLFLPKDFIKKPPPTSKYRHKVRVAGDEANQLELMNGEKKIQYEMEEDTIELPPLMDSFLSPLNLLHIFWLCVLQLRFYFFLGSLNTFLEEMFTKAEVSHYTNSLTYILMCGLVAAPFAGFVFDLHKHFFRVANSRIYRSLMPSVIPLAATTVICMVLSGLMLLEQPQILYVVFILVLFFRSFLYTIGSGFISSFFPVQHFGSLYGISLLFAGVFSALQYAFYTLAEATSFYQVNVILMVAMTVTFIHPVVIWWKCWKAKRPVIG